MNPDDQRTSCPGFLDEFGIWNNGFECPPLSGQIRICCESESRRYCCILENFHKTSSNPLNALEKNSYSTIETSFYVTDTKSSTLFTFPMLFICILILIIIFFVIFLSVFFWYRYRNRNDKQKRQENLSTKTNLLVDHFPFSPPHHKFFLNENNSHFNNKTLRLHHHPQAKDTLTTTTMAPSTTTSTSSTSGRIPSDIYFNDWKDFLIAADQPMNIYPTMSSHSNELNNDQQYFQYHGKRQQNDVIV
jgi:hypothetical protein